MDVPAAEEDPYHLPFIKIEKLNFTGQGAYAIQLPSSKTPADALSHPRMLKSGDAVVLDLMYGSTFKVLSRLGLV